MKRFLKYAAVSLCAALVTLSCSKQGDGLAGEGGKGVLKINISATRTETGGYDPLDHVVVRILNSEGGLLRKYTSITDMPERLELLAGAYSVSVEAGEEAVASFDKRLYIGSQNFTVVAGETTPVTVVCKNQSTVADVTFDQTVTANFSRFHSWVAVGEQVDEIKAMSGEQPALKFTVSAKGYFTMPEGATRLAWKFSGKHNSRGDVENEGVVENVQPGVRYKLTFRYSKDLPGFIACFAVLVDPSTDDEDDTIIFSPDPTVSGVGFSINDPQGYIDGTTGEKSYKIATIGKMSGVNATFGGQTYDLFNGTTAGVTVVREDAYNLTATFSPAFFAGHQAGEQPLTFEITDEDAGYLKAESVYRIQGMIPFRSTDYNLWSNTLTLRVMVVDPAITPSFELSDKNGQKQQVVGVKDDKGVVTAVFAPEWVEGVNENTANPTKTYRRKAGTGVFAANTYTYSVTIGSDLKQESFDTPAGDTIYNSGMELWTTYKVTGSMATGGTVAFPNESSSKVFWVGSNNNNTKSLCTGQSIEGNNGALCAQLHPQAATGDNFAAGSLFTGTIDFGTGLLDMFGFARFGVQYRFSARPSALRVHYKAVITKVTHTGKTPLTTNDNDPARIFVVITDWKGRHAVQSGVSFDEATFWDPVKVSALNEGPILGYGSKMITESTDGWVTEELPIVWYDKESAPGKDSYSLSISAASSAYGDYMGGSLNNYLYIEDFEWVY